MDDEVQIQVWIKRGIMMVNTYALDFDDPMHPYNQVLAMGKDPSDYGFEHPNVEEFKDVSRDALIKEVVELRKEVKDLMRHCG